MKKKDSATSEYSQNYNNYTKSELYKKARQLKQVGDLSRANEAYTTYSQLYPDDINGWLGLGLVLREQELFTQAAIAFERYLQQRSDVSVRNVLVTSLWRINQVDSAKKHGYINLEEKDRLALLGFEKSPFHNYQLQPRSPKFSSENKQRNIIAFSLWGDDPAYVTGAIVNAQLAPHVYPGWTARFYCDQSVPEDARRNLINFGAQVQLIEDAQLAQIKPMWRFLVSDDPNVDFFVCRDTDSRINIKEATAVYNWICSGKRFHVMRDHVFHMDLILAGMWGGIAGVLPSMQDWLIETPDYFNNKFGDQEFLKDMVWPLIKFDMCTHDSVYGFPDQQGFPPGFQLPGMVHVGGAIKKIAHWREMFA